MNELKCPARTHGRIAVCHFCIYTAGGPSNLCVRMLERYHQDHASQVVDLPIVTDSLETISAEND